MAKRPRPEPTTDQAKPSQPSGATLGPDILARVREAGSVEEAVTILAPNAKRSPKPDAVYEVSPACGDPLPKQRGLAILVYATAARLNASFKVADIEAALPDRKSVRYWVRQLAKTGHFVEVVS